jgi:hypothetical protein
MSRSKSRRKKGVTSPDLTLVSVSQALLVGEHLSFRRVATVLGVRQSAVSRRVRELEDELGVSLFERHHAGVRVTNAGARFLQSLAAMRAEAFCAISAFASARSCAVRTVHRPSTGGRRHRRKLSGRNAFANSSSSVKNSEAIERAERLGTVK